MYKTDRIYNVPKYNVLKLGTLIIYYHGHKYIHGIEHAKCTLLNKANKAELLIDVKTLVQILDK
jgi:hypothetical protein